MSRGLSRQLLVIVMLLSIYGALMIYSAGQIDFGSPNWSVHFKWIRHLEWLCVAVVAAFLVNRVSFRLLEWATPWLYGLGIVLLVVTLAIGTGSGDAASSKSWLAIGGVKLGQPVELAKLATILMLARWFSARRSPPTTLRGLFPPLMISIVPALLVLKQPDLGSAMVFGGAMFAVFFWAGVPVSLLVLLASPVISLLLAWSTALWSAWMIVLFILLLAWRPFILEAITVYLVNATMGVLAILVWNHIDKYQRARITSFINPALDPAHTAYQAIQSKVAIGSGSWLGNGFTLGPLKRTGFIPEWSTDFIFATVGEELGFVGVILALGLFLALLITLVRIARRSSDPFASIVVFGVAGLFLTHIFENIGMTISLMPITGIPLPFFSYGGSFLLATFLALGMAFRAAAEERAAGYV